MQDQYSRTDVYKRQGQLAGGLDLNAVREGGRIFQGLILVLMLSLIHICFKGGHSIAQGGDAVVSRFQPAGEALSRGESDDATS